MLYQLLFRFLLRRIPAEQAHALAKASLRLVMATRPGRALVRRLVGPTPSCLVTHALGRTFSSPLGVAAGVDKDVTWFEGLGALGFGFVEVGTITALPQRGNPKPRVARVTADRAIVNRMGFPNPGAAVAAERLTKRSAQPVVGVNIGKSMTTLLDDAASDYRATTRRLAPVADYLVLNVSSPNTPGLRALHTPDRLRALVGEIRAELSEIDRAPPLLVKISPDLEDDELDAIARLARELQLDGIVCVNTSVDHGVLSDRGASVASLGGGGVSGKPLGRRAADVLRRIRRAGGDSLVLISVGGVESADDVWERLRAGASLIQVYAALVYEGPGWPKRVNQELSLRVRDAGLTSIRDVVGADDRDAGESRSAAGLEAL